MGDGEQDRRIDDQRRFAVAAERRIRRRSRTARPVGRSLGRGRPLPPQGFTFGPSKKVTSKFEIFKHFFTTFF